MNIFNKHFRPIEKMDFSHTITAVTFYSLSAIFGGGFIWALIIGKGSISWLLQYL